MLSSASSSWFRKLPIISYPTRARRIIVNHHQLSFSLSLFKFFIIVDDSFSRFTTRMIVNDSVSVRPYSGQKTCCRPLSSRKIHTFASLSYGTPFCIRIFTRKELGTRCSRDFAYMTVGELSSTITNFFGRLTIWTIVDDSWGESTIIDYHAPFDQGLIFEMFIVLIKGTVIKHKF